MDLESLEVWEGAVVVVLEFVFFVNVCRLSEGVRGLFDCVEVNDDIGIMTRCVKTTQRF